MTRETITHFTPQKPVIGDGTTGKTRLAQRWQRWKVLGVVIGCVLFVGFLTTIIRPAGNQIPMHPQNAEPSGAMAVTQILQNNGVNVTVTGSLAEARAAADSSTTIFVYDTFVVESSFYREAHDAGADLVIVDPANSTINQLNLGVFQQNASSDALTSGPVAAQCSAPHAQAARHIPAQERGFALSGGSDTELCFAIDGVGSYAASADNRVHLFATAAPFQNSHLANSGHAALTIGALGQKENLVWFLPTSLQNPSDAGDDGSIFVFLPPWFPAALTLVGFIALFLALWRGRRMGRLVSEPLPVVVRGAETTVGLGQVYRRANEIQHTADALRSGTALRCAQRLGVAPTAAGADLCAAIAHSVNRSYEEITVLLFGPPPRTSAELIRLTQMLDHLESEVHSS